MYKQGRALSQLQAHKYSMGEASVDIHLYISAGSECGVRPQPADATRKCLKSMGCSLFPRYQRTKSQDPASGKSETRKRAFNLNRLFGNLGADG